MFEHTQLPYLKISSKEKEEKKKTIERFKKRFEDIHNPTKKKGLKQNKFGAFINLKSQHRLCSKIKVT